MTRAGSSREPVRVARRSQRNKSSWKIKRVVRRSKNKLKVLIVRKSKIRILIEVEQRL